MKAVPERLQQPGRVVLVGAGPGDVELLTLKAARLIREADFLVHDALVQSDILALARGAQIIPVGKRAGNPSARQSSINEILVECARRGGLTVRLKGGDPLIFARAQEELNVLKTHGIPFEVVPGISTAQAAHAALAMPMTERGHRRAMVLATPQIHAPARPTAGPAHASQPQQDQHQADTTGTASTANPGQSDSLRFAPRQVAGSHDPAPLRASFDHKPCPSAALTPADIIADDQLRRWAEAIVAAGSGSLYMASSVCHQVRDTLLLLGMPADTSAIWLIDVSLPSQTVIRSTLGALQPVPDEYKGQPALLVLGGSPHQDT